MVKENWGICVIGLFTIVIGIAAIRTNLSSHPLRSSLLINLLASGITIIMVWLVIDSRAKHRRQKDYLPAKKLSDKILKNAVIEFFAVLGGNFMLATGFNLDVVVKSQPGESLRQSIRRKARDDYEKGKEILVPLTVQDLAGKYNSIGKTAAQYSKIVEQAVELILEKYSYSLSNSNKAQLFDIRDSLNEASTMLTNLMEPNNRITGFNPEHGDEISNTDFSGEQLTSLQAYLTIDLIKICNKCDNFVFKIHVE